MISLVFPSVMEFLEYHFLELGEFCKRVKQKADFNDLKKIYKKNQIFKAVVEC